jgi:signal transduction histidine kinase
VRADPVLLEQAMLNLLTNACEAGGAPVELRADPDPLGGVRLSVIDCGSGIAAEDQPLVFEPFFTRKPTGTGLGLPVVQRIVELHGGSIELRRRPGGGTEAALHLPAERGEATR